MVNTFGIYVGKNTIHFDHNSQKINCPLIFNICWPNFPLGIFQPNYTLITKFSNTNKYLISLSKKEAKSHLEKD